MASLIFCVGCAAYAMDVPDDPPANSSSGSSTTNQSVANNSTTGSSASKTSTSDTANGATGTPSAAGKTVVAPKSETRTIILAGGCFWCTEAVFERVKGVRDVVSGYIGGTLLSPTYADICTGTTGHAEAVKIEYDPRVVRLPYLLEVFFKTHDPTSLNRQGADHGTQYRSAIFVANKAQRAVCESMIEKINAAKIYDDPIVTSLEPVSTFYVAEDYHQDYFRLNPNKGYCQAVVKGKVEKFEALFGG